MVVDGWFSYKMELAFPDQSQCFRGHSIRWIGFFSLGFVGPVMSVAPVWAALVTTYLARTPRPLPKSRVGMTFMVKNLTYLAPRAGLWDGVSPSTAILGYGSKNRNSKMGCPGK